MNWQLGTMVCLPTKLLAREKWWEKNTAYHFGSNKNATLGVRCLKSIVLIFL